MCLRSTLPPRDQCLAGWHGRHQWRNGARPHFGLRARRFAALRAPSPVQCLADNFSAYTARETLDFAAALFLVPCFTPVRRPESNSVSEALVETLKRDHTRVQSSPDTLTVAGATPGLDRRGQRKAPAPRLADALAS